MLLHLLWNLITFFIALGILITVHEFGHFLMARCFEVKVERFSIGFGPTLWNWRDSNNTEYVISIILIGGYVKLFDSPTNNIIYNNIKNTFNYKNIWQKSAIILAGPIFNFILSILLYTLVYVKGIPIHKPVIHAIIPNSIVAHAGVLAGTEIKSVNNIHTRDWEAVRFQILNNIGKKEITISTTSINNTCPNIYIFRLSKFYFDIFNKIKDPIVALGILPYNIQTIPILLDVQSNSIAEHSGLKIGDKILAIDDQPINNWNDFTSIFKNNPEKNFKISVERKYKTLHYDITLDKKRHLTNVKTIEEIIGFFPKIITIPTKNYCVIQKYQLHRAIFQACIKTWELIYLIVNTLMKLIIGDIKTLNIGGPISIARGAGESANFGLIYYLIFLAGVSINLGIINLLPLPMLDGGHLFFLILEKINGKLISQKTRNFGHIVGFILLTLIMCFAIFKDISKLWYLN